MYRFVNRQNLSVNCVMTRIRIVTQVATAAVIFSIILSTAFSKELDAGVRTARRMGVEAVCTSSRARMAPFASKDLRVWEALAVNNGRIWDLEREVSAISRRVSLVDEHVWDLRTDIEVERLKERVEKIRKARLGPRRPGKVLDDGQKGPSGER